MNPSLWYQCRNKTPLIQSRPLGEYTLSQHNQVQLNNIFFRCQCFLDGPLHMHIFSKLFGGCKNSKLFATHSMHLIIFIEACIIISINLNNLLTLLWDGRTLCISLIHHLRYILGRFLEMSNVDKLNSY